MKYRSLLQGLFTRAFLPGVSEFCTGFFLYEGIFRKEFFRPIYFWDAKDFPNLREISLTSGSCALAPSILEAQPWVKSWGTINVAYDATRVKVSKVTVNSACFNPQISCTAHWQQIIYYFSNALWAGPLSKSISLAIVTSTVSAKRKMTGDRKFDGLPGKKLRATRPLRIFVRRWCVRGLENVDPSQSKPKFANLACEFGLLTVNYQTPFARCMYANVRNDEYFENHWVTLSAVATTLIDTWFSGWSYYALNDTRTPALLQNIIGLMEYM